MTTATDITATNTTDVEIHNRVVLIGTLNMQAADRLLNTRRQNDRAELEQVLIQTVTAFGEACAIELDVSVATPGYELLTKKNAGMQLAVEGELRRKAEIDKRYAVADQEIGARMLRYRFHVNAIRLPREDEPITTFAQIQGVVVAEPLFQRHAMLIGTEIARTIVQVSYSQPSNYPGSRAVVPTTMEIAVSVPLAHPDAAKLLRPGNKVVIEGGIDSVIVSQLRNETAAAKVEQLDQAWTERREKIAPADLEKELRDYRRERGRFAETQALSVVAGYVELLAGTPREIEEAREASGRNSYQNRQRRVVVAAPAAPGAVAVEESGGPVEQPALIVAQEPDVPAAVEQQAPPPVADPVKPRRKEPPAMVQAAPAVAQAAPAGVEDDELGAAEVEPADLEVEPAGAEGNGNGHLVEK